MGAVTDEVEVDGAVGRRSDRCGIGDGAVGVAATTPVCEHTRRLETHTTFAPEPVEIDGVGESPLVVVGGLGVGPRREGADGESGAGRSEPVQVPRAERARADGPVVR